MRLPDSFQDHDKPERQYEQAGLDADAIVATVLATLHSNSAALETKAGA
jgi:1-deoxy-D-xylulose-5-phosphate synthase